ncbi:MAG: hypothetical protein V4590_05720 [Bacteroidota bacterium]
MLKNSYRCLVVWLSCLSTSVFAQSVRVTNTEIIENQTKVVVSYQITPVDDDKVYTTALFLSTDGGTTFQQLKAVSGNIGELKELPVYNQKVVWDIFKDVAELTGSIVFEVRLTTKLIPVPIKQMVMYRYTPSAPFGVTYARVRKIGYYGSIKTNFASQSSDYEASEKGLTNYNGNGYWQIGSESKVTRFSITGGGIYKWRRDIYVYGGLGYGSRRLLWSYDSFKADDTADKSGFAEVIDVSYTGVEMEFGAIYLMRKFFPVSFGLNTINGGFWEINLGVGYCF